MALPRITIPGVEFLEPIGRGGDSSVYKARHHDAVVAVKLLNTPVPQHDVAHRRFLREAAALASIAHPGLATVMEVGSIDDYPFIVMEYIQGSTLAAVIAQGMLSPARVVRIGMDVASVLAAMHRFGLIHHDIKPHNIILDPFGRARVIDLGFAAAPQHLANDHLFAGTLAYSAPEQSGMLKRPVDMRSDLYSLGVVLYECATGAAPFQSSDVSELLRQHAVAQPRSVHEHNPAIGPALSQVIAKLLAKDPDDRYQTAAGLRTDLAQIDTLDAMARDGKPLMLGVQDSAIAVSSSLPIIGRTALLDELNHRWQDALHGQGTVVFVEGAPGVGKTHLIRGFLDRVRATNSLVLSGRCSPDKPLPFAPLREAIDTQIQSILRLPLMPRQAAIERIRGAVDPYGPLLKRFSPLLASILKDTPAIEGLDEAHEQFYEAIVHCLLRLVHDSGGAVLFLDNLDALDDSSRHVLKRLSGQIATSPLLIVGTYDAIGTTLAAPSIDVGIPSTQRIQVQPFTDEESAQLINAHLGGLPLDPAIIDHITACTNGNPLTINTYIAAMIDAGIVRPSWGRWVADREALQNVTLSTDIVHLLIQRLQLVSPASRDVLQRAAVIGRRFDVDRLTDACDCAPETIYLALSEGLAARILEQETGEYAFVHTTIHEVLLEHVDSRVQRSVHQRIAHAMDRRGALDDETIYALARHYTLGHGAEDVQRVFETNRNAGIKALKKYAYEDAYQFLTHAHAVMSTHAMGVDPVLEHALGEACARLGKMDQALQHFERLLDVTPDPLERSRIRAKRSLNMIGDQSWDELGRAFAEVGRSIPRLNASEITGALRSWIQGWVASRFGVTRIASGHTRDQIIVAVELYELAGHQAYWTDRRLLIPLSAMHVFDLSHRLGVSPELARSYSNYAMVLLLMGFSKPAQEYSRKSVQMAEQLNDPISLARNLMYDGVINHFQGNVLQAEQTLRRCLEGYGQWLTIKDYLNACVDLAINLLVRGYVNAAQVWLRRSMSKAEQTTNTLEEATKLHPCVSLLGLTLAMQGAFDEAEIYFQREQQYTQAEPDDTYRRNLLLGNEVLRLLEQGSVGDSLNAVVREHRTLGLKPKGAAYHLRLFFLAQAYARLRQCRLAHAAPTKRQVQDLKNAIDALDQAANVPVLRCHHHVVKAAWADLSGDREQSLNLLAQAENLAQQTDNRWASYEIALQRAFMLRSYDESMATRQAGLAAAMAVEYGWVNRSTYVRDTFHLLSPHASSQAKLSSKHGEHVVPTQTTLSSMLQLQRYLDALLRVSLASASAIDPNTLAQGALDQIIHILGAERAFLFLTREQSDHLVFGAGRDSEKNNLPVVERYSRTIIEEVRRKRQPIIISGTEEGAILGATSVVAHNLRSIMAAPLMFHDRLLGVVYLDNHLVKGMFTEGDVNILTAIANHIAISLETSQVLQKNKALLEALPDAMLRIRHDGTLIDFRSTTGLTQDVLWSEEWSHHFRHLTERTLQEQRIQVNEYQVMRNERPLDFEARAVVSGEGEVLILVRDITERKQVDRIKDEFISIVSHQLRTPLTSMTMALDIVTHSLGSSIPGNLHQILHIAQRNGQRLGKLINDMLLIIQIRSREVQFQYDVARLEPLIERAIGENRSPAESLGIGFVVTLEDPEIAAYVDPDRCVQALSQVINNAVRVSPVGASVHIHGSRRDQSVLVTCKDYGAGIDPHIQPRIFDAFSQTNVNLETERHEGSAGLGLSLTSSIIQCLHGRIWFETTEGMGTTFFIELPVAAD